MKNISVYHQIYVKRKQGFVLLFAVLVSGILLAIGLGIFTITYKELLLSSSDRESQIAFYAADSGGECALYWDVVHPGYERGIFGRVTDTAVSPAISGIGNALCSGVDINNTWTTTGSGVSPIETVFTIGFENGSCAEVTVVKKYDDISGESITEVDSRGFNTCDEGAMRRAERGLRITY
ncbi:MAG: hypothetical protein HGB03_02685 [Candidatus Yonathbacteria bacterium]|nr:hypothetical protein [Candidatus Yonathbacteria bacterium]NTW47452.1 hypothetical protein [Candidatus Yonathbacteria bacterium]